MARCNTQCFRGKQAAGAHQQDFSYGSSNLFASIWKHKNVFKCPRIHTQAAFCEALKPQNIMSLKSCPWPLRSTDWCFNQRDPEKLLANLQYFILFYFISFFFSFFHSSSLSFILSLWLQYIWPKAVDLFFCGCKI